MKKLKASWITKNQETRLYQIPVPVIGLTGGIGTGKSTVAEILREKNIPVIDADRLVKNIYTSPASIRFLKKHFPHSILDEVINFQKLRETIFANESAKNILEDFIYSYLPEEFIKAFEKFNNPKFIVYDVPLLFEKKLNEKVDLTVCVYAPRKTQIERIVARDKTSIELAQKILKNQMDIDEKKELADIVINNEQDINALKLSVEKFLKEITA